MRAVFTLNITDTRFWVLQYLQSSSVCYSGEQMSDNLVDYRELDLR